MKRNMVLAIAVTVMMVAATVAQAADVSFSGQVRPRFNIDSDSNSGTSPQEFFDTRVRLNAKANVNANTEVFLQLQSVGNWGADAGGRSHSGTRQSTGGGGEQANDNLSDVGLHQAYLTLKNFANTSLDAKIGRQEVVIDGHRLFGHTGWTQGAQSSDAIRLFHNAGNHSVSYSYIQGDENSGTGNSNAGDETVHVLYANTQGVLGGSLSGIFTFTDDDNGSNAGQDKSQWYTVGARQKGKLGGLDYRVEFYHQFGDAGNIANTCACGITGAVAGTGDAVDRNAQMFGVRVGKTFANKLNVTLWYDNLSGQDDDNNKDGDFGQFDTMYDTGHKFYGFQDFYLSRVGGGTGYYGLQDMAIKAKMPIRAGWTAKADMHWFRTQTDLGGADSTAVRDADADFTSDQTGGNDLGSELDLTLVHKYDSNTTIAAGYSHYWTTTTFAQLNGTGTKNAAESNDGSDWMYVQIDTKF